MHLCDNPPCFRFDHLRLGTHAENLADMRAKGRGVDPLPQHGTDHWAAKLNETDVLAIRRYRGVRSAKELANQHGVTGATIYMIWNRDTWARLPDEGLDK